MDKFKLILKNPILDSYSHILLKDDYISDTLGYQLSIPVFTDKSFIFSCFALSVDGKLYYPDARSGFSIASCNSHATSAEKRADLFILMLARAISDAIIVGTTSINNESGNFLLNIPDPKLSNLRYKYSGSTCPATIIICRDLNNINFAGDLFNDDLHQVIICCINGTVNLTRLPGCYTQLDIATLTNKNQLKLKNLIVVNKLEDIITKLHQLGFNIILNESPYFHHQLLRLELLDEMWLNYSGSYIGGNQGGLGSIQIPFDSKNHPECEILTLHHLGYNFIYTRQKILNKLVS